MRHAVHALVDLVASCVALILLRQTYRFVFLSRRHSFRSCLQTDKNNYAEICHRLMMRAWAEIELDVLLDVSRLGSWQLQISVMFHDATKKLKACAHT